MFSNVLPIVIKTTGVKGLVRDWCRIQERLLRVLYFLIVLRFSLLVLILGLSAKYRLSSYNFGQSKLEQQTRLLFPINWSRMKPRDGQSGPFSHPWFEFSRAGLSTCILSKTAILDRINDTTAKRYRSRGWTFWPYFVKSNESQLQEEALCIRQLNGTAIWIVPFTQFQFEKHQLNSLPER